MRKHAVPVFFAAALALALLGCQKNTGTATMQAPYVNIYIDDEIHAQIPLSEPQTYTLTQSGDKVNEIVVEEDRVYMQAATCPEKDCVHQGAVTLENYNERPLREWIVCLPNRVTVELVAEESA
ncbi:NusG domain II-containing protein [Christensenellaceae bacterium OttesenSCG-928-L17]|nr:NusG domain II-containing protein [Christensenellaceae bacterium OttesenSCG-928-L17]